MEIKKLNTVHVWISVKQSYQFIMLNPMLSISFALIGALAMFIALHIPVPNPLPVLLLIPVLITGHMHTTRAISIRYK